MNLLFLAHYYTDKCLERRDSFRYYSPAGRKKTHLLSLLLREIGLGINICSASFSKKGDKSFFEQIDGLNIWHCPVFVLWGGMTVFKRTVSAAYAFWQILRSRKSIDYVVIYNYHWEFALPVLLARKIWGVKFILEYEDGLFLNPKYQRGVYPWIEKTIYRHAAGFLMANGALSKRVREYNPNAPICEVNGCFDMSLTERYRGRELSAKTSILYSGNFSYDRGFDELVEYVNFLPDSVCLHITGTADKEELGVLKGIVNDRANVYYHGFVSEDKLDQLLGEAHGCLLLHAATKDLNQTNFPSKLFDYLSKGKKVITTKNPILKNVTHLDSLLTIDSIESDFLKIEEMLERASTQEAEIRELHEQMKNDLKSFFESL